MGKYDQFYNIVKLFYLGVWGIKDLNLNFKFKIMLYFDNGWDWGVQEWFYSSVFV